MHSFRIATMKSGLMALALAPALAFSAWVHFDPSDTSKVPKLFSQTGFYSSMNTHAVTGEAVAFDVNAPLWSDNAHKHRWVLLKPGTAKIKFDPAADYFEYPDGAVFVKLFQHDTIPGDTTTRIYWETRVLVNKKTPDTLSWEPLNVAMRDKWYPFSYKWKRDGSEAQLVSPNGEVASLTLTIKGQKTFRKWNFPGTTGCNNCHRQFSNDTQGRTVLGFFPPQINRQTASAANLNQVRELFQKNILTWDKAAPTEAELAAMPKWARIDDTTTALDIRAKAYIAANCSGCHGTRGISTGGILHAPTQFNYDFIKTERNALVWTQDLRTVGSTHFEGMPFVLTPSGDTMQTAAVVPGHPELSTVLFRMKQRNTLDPADDDAYLTKSSQMPPLGVFEVDTIATRWLERWIKEMPALGIHAGHPGLKTSAHRWAGEYLILASAAPGQVTLSGLDGRRIELLRVTGTTYRLPRSLKNGVYLLRVGGNAYKVVK